MKAKYILVSLLLVALVMGGTGYGVAAGSGGKVTGGGTFPNLTPVNDYANPLDKISLGFNAQGQGDNVKGQFHLINHDSGMKVSGTVSELIDFGSIVSFNGPCSIDGEESYFWAEMVTDGGEGKGAVSDNIWISFGAEPSVPPHIAGLIGVGNQGGGNIQKHK
jgi:hypothetical protein